MKLFSGINLMEELSKVKEYWSPQVIGQVNDQYIKVAKLKGQFVWHKHDDEDEMFIVIYGNLRIELEDGEVNLKEGDLFVVPKNTMHKPVADEECGIVLIETVSTLHTGNIETPIAKTIDQQLFN